MQTTGMTRTIALLLTLAAGPTSAEVRIIQSPDGLQGTVADPGNGVGIRSDPHGRRDVLVAPLDSAIPLSPGPHGDLHRQTVTPFQTPPPPNQLTPAPVLPFQPNRPPAPIPSTPPSAAPHPGGSGGRIGR